jgi:signal transduction histidine kinase
MKEGNDFPFAVSEGFSQDFLAQENTLLDSFSSCCGSCGHLSCYCGQTINDGIYSDGKKNGLNFVRELPSEDDGTQIFGKRGTCWKEGYQSLVRIPLRDSGNVFGLLLLNDRRPGLLTPEIKEKLSSIAFVLSVCLCSHDFNVTRQELDNWRQSLQRSRAEFLTLVNHELRTPLSGLLSVLELLRGEMSKEDYNTLLNTARGCAEDLFTKVKNLLDTSKLSVGKHIFSPEAFSPAEALNEVCAKFNYKAQLKGLELAVNVSDSVPGAFINDENAFRKIIFNLLDNALKFTDRGKISVSLAQEPGGSQLLLTVWDTGCGFAAPVQESRYFEPFCLLESIYTRQHDGLGLGLPVSSGLLRAMGGGIRIESNPGMGCLVSCRFPELSIPGAVENRKEMGDFFASHGLATRGDFSFFNPEKVLFNMGGDCGLLRDVVALGAHEIPIKMSALFDSVSGNNSVLSHPLSG